MTYDDFKETLEEKLDDIYEFIKYNTGNTDVGDAILDDIDALKEDALDLATSVLDDEDNDDMQDDAMDDDGSGY